MKQQHTKILTEVQADLDKLASTMREAGNDRVAERLRRLSCDVQHVLITCPVPTCHLHRGGAMNAEFTPGPWEATNGGPRSKQWTVWADAGEIGDLRVAVMPYELFSQAANARLIAAAPDLFEACEAVLAGGMWSEVSVRCAEALVKARGEASLIGASRGEA